jgi:hypothetical protein
MTPDRIEQHIDTRISSYLGEGLRLDEIILNLNGNIESFSKRDSFIRVKKRYLLRNWDLIKAKKKYTTYCVIHYTRRVKDLEWAIKNKEKFPNLNDTKLFGLVLLRDKLLFNNRVNGESEFGRVVIQGNDGLDFGPSLLKPGTLKEKIGTKIDLEKDDVGILWKHWIGQA